MKEKTLVLIKPDAFEKNHTGEIIAIYEKKGLKLFEASFLCASSASTLTARM